MKIIKSGRKDRKFRFRCTCGCVFECLEREVRTKVQRPAEDPAVFFDCPECRKTVGCTV